MALTKKDLKDITKLINEPIEKALKRDIEPTENDFTRWEKEGTQTKVGILAPENFKLNGKEYFTWDEAMALELPEGWRLPTMSEWATICEEFGKDDEGRIQGDILSEKLKLPKTGYMSPNGDIQAQTSYAHYWSATAYSGSSYAYTLYFNSGSVLPAASVDKSYGFAVRLIKGDL